MMTEWYPEHIKPVRAGVYERKIFDNPTYSLWNGKFWCSYCATVYYASTDRSRSFFQHAPWRGFTTPQE